jgi:hypothetical protein
MHTTLSNQRLDLPTRKKELESREARDWYSQIGALISDLDHGLGQCCVALKHFDTTAGGIAFLESSSKNVSNLQALRHTSKAFDRVHGKLQSLRAKVRDDTDIVSHLT